MLTGLKSFFLPDIDVEHAADARRIVRAGLAVIAVLVFVVGGWMAFAPLHGAVVAPGLIRVDTFRKTVQHQEGGIVREILVREGQRVNAGDPLLVLGDVRVSAAFDAVRTQLDGELAREARLQAERAAAERVTYPKEILDRIKDPRVAELVQRETNLFTTRRAVLASQVELLRSQVLETRSEMAALEGEIQADDRAIAYQKEELASNEQLIEQGFITRSRLLTLQRNVADYESRRGENLAELSKARQKISELEFRALGLKNNYMQQAADELKDSTGKVFELLERVRASRDAADRQTVTAPVGGTVVDLKVTTLGFTVGPREPLLDISPDDPDLIVEARVRPEDINYTRQAADADVRLTAFKQRLTPVVSGKVIYVSPDRLTDRSNGTPYYTAHVRVDPASLAEAGDLKLQAGMPAEVYIRHSARTPLQYLVDPVLGYIRRAMREP
jgi:HlyD family type I secretion membrane fusion protein